MVNFVFNVLLENLKYLKLVASSTQIIQRLSISQDKRDIALLQLIRQYLNCGSYRWLNFHPSLRVREMLINLHFYSRLPSQEGREVRRKASFFFCLFCFGKARFSLFF